MAAATLTAHLGRAALAVLAVAVGGALLTFAGITYRSHAVLAQAQEAQAWGRLEVARDTLERATSIAPGDAQLHAALGSVNASIARFRPSDEAEDEAIAATRRAVALKPLDAELHAALASVLLQFGRLEEAAEAYQQALDLDPHNALLLGSLAEVRERQDRFAEAADLYLAALAIRPNASLESRLERVQDR